MIDEKMSEEQKGKNKNLAGILIVAGILGAVFSLIAYIGSTASNSGSTTTSGIGNGNQTAWYYVNANQQCVQAPGSYKGEDECQSAMGSSCFPDTPNCNGMNKSQSLYYINSSNNCVLAPHNPYPIVFQSMTAGTLAQQYNCEQDVGYSCYTENTCGGVGQPNMATIKGVSYRIVSVNDLLQNTSNPGFANTNGTGTVSMVAVKGVVKAIFPEKDGTDYDLVIQTSNGYIIDSVGTIDINTKASNGFYPNDFPIGTNIIAGGAFVGGYMTLGALSEGPSPSPKIMTLGLPSNTFILVNGLGDVEQAP